MPVVSVNGAELVYEDIGERASLRAHAWADRFRDDFRERLPALAELGRTIIYDHRGHGDSANTGDRTATRSPSSSMIWPVCSTRSA
jgi:pimeloyl-ACP methyl ester carboxylesterase